MRTKQQTYLNDVWTCHALDLLTRLPDTYIDAVISDPMYGIASKPSRHSSYDWGPEPFHGDPAEWWAYHRPIYQECRRVLKPGGRLAWAMGCKFREHFQGWFGGYRIWSFARHFLKGRNAFGHIWLVQTREQTPIGFPDADSLIIVRPRPAWRLKHPCPKHPEELLFMVEHLTQPSEIVLDCFAGIGTTLQAAKQLKRQFIGCDLSPGYCRLAKWGVDQVVA